MSETLGEAMNAERAWAAMTDEQRAALEESMSGPETLSQALARAQRAKDETLRERVKRYLLMPGLRERRTILPKRESCSRCFGSPRYPDHRCATHSGYLPENPTEAHKLDNDDAHWLLVWRLFFDRVASILRT